MRVAPLEDEDLSRREARGDGFGPEGDARGSRADDHEVEEVAHGFSSK
jgi:hypothetical protein